MQRKDARCPYAFPMDPFSGSSDVSFPTLTPTQNPLLQNLLNGFDALGISSPRVRNPRYDVTELFELGYDHGYIGGSEFSYGDCLSEVHWDYLDFQSGDGYDRAGSLESDALTTLSDGVDGGIWYPRFHEYGSYPRMSGAGIAGRMIPDSSIYPALNRPGPSGLNGNNLENSFTSRQVMRRSDVDQGADERSNFCGYPQDLLRRNLNVGMPTGFDASPWCSSLALIHASIQDLQSRIRSIAKSRTGYKILLEKMDDMKAAETDIVFCDLLRDLGELMVDPFANHVIQKLIDVCSDEQRAKILYSVTRDTQLIRTCLDQYGARVIQRLLEILTPDWQKQEFALAIRPGVLQLTKNTNGHQVILHILKVFPADCYQVLLILLNDKFYEIATDQHGCRVVIKHIQNVKGDRSDRMVAQTVAHAFTLSEHCYGNYVVQALLGAEMTLQLLYDLHQQFMGSYSALSFGKFASNVVEKCLAKAEGRDFMQIVCELLDDFLLLLSDEYANYVAQKMIVRSKALGMPVYGILVDRIRACHSLIEASIYGRKALERLVKNNDINILREGSRISISFLD